MKPKNKKIALAVIFTLFLFVSVVAFALILAFNVPVNDKCVAVVRINGEITAESTNSLFEDHPGSEEIAEAIRKLNDRDDVGSVLVVINSPGGSVYGSREIYEALESLDKPKVTYMKEIAASGGYYIASGTDYIMADPTTLTGSIGVISMYTDFTPLLKKIGVNVSPIKSGAHKDIGSGFRPMTEEEKEILQSIVNEVFENFKEVVIKSRKGKLNMKKFNEILDGRVLTGKQAKEVGLVDELGTYHDALLKAGQLAGIRGEPRTCEIELEQKSLFAGLDSLFFGDALSSFNRYRVSLKYE